MRRRHLQSTEMDVTLREGRNREIRRILARVGHKILQLKRIALGPLRLGGLPLGAHRRLTNEEVRQLARAARPGDGSGRRKRAENAGRSGVRDPPAVNLRRSSSVLPRGPRTQRPPVRGLSWPTGSLIGGLPIGPAGNRSVRVVTMANNPLHAAYYADHAVQRTAAVLANQRLARDTYRVRIECPEIASAIVPGQFVMLRLTGCDDPLIGRPLALYDTVLSTSGEPYAINVVYLVKGKFTRRLEGCATGQKLDVWGPLGNGFASRSSEHLIMVAGGIGQTPFVALAQEVARPASLWPSSADGRRMFSGDPLLRRANGGLARRSRGLSTVGSRSPVGDRGRNVRSSGSGYGVARTDPPSSGDDSACRVLRARADDAAVASLAAATRTPCEVSLESPMACGIGICFSCVVKVRDGAGGWDYRRSCVEGPVFDAAAIEW